MLEFPDNTHVSKDSGKMMDLDGVKIAYFIMNNQLDGICPSYYSEHDNTSEDNNKGMVVEATVRPKTQKRRRKYKPFNHNFDVCRLYVNESPNCSEILDSLVNNLNSFNYNPESKENYVRLLSMLFYILKNQEHILKNKNKDSDKNNLYKYNDRNNNKNRIVENTLEMYSKYIDKIFLNDDLVINLNLKILIECVIKIDLKYLNYYINKVKLMEFLTKFNDANRYYNVFNMYYYYFDKYFYFNSELDGMNNIFKRFIENKRGDNSREKEKDTSKNNEKENKGNEKKSITDLFYLNTKLKLVLILLIYLKGVRFSNVNFNLSNNLIKIVDRYIKAEKNYDCKLVLLYLLILISSKNKNNSLVDIITGGLVSIISSNTTTGSISREEEENKRKRENDEYLWKQEELINKIFMKYVDLLCSSNVESGVGKIMKRLNRFDIRMIHHNIDGIYRMNKKVYIVYVNKLVINNNNLNIKLKMIIDYVKRLNKVPININRQVFENLLNNRNNDIEYQSLVYELVLNLGKYVGEYDSYCDSILSSYGRFLSQIEKLQGKESKENKNKKDDDKRKRESNEDRLYKNNESSTRDEDEKRMMELYGNFLSLVDCMKNSYKVKGAFNSLRLLKDPFIGTNMESINDSNNKEDKDEKENDKDQSNKRMKDEDKEEDKMDLGRLELDSRLMKVLNGYNIGNNILVNKQQQNVFLILSKRYLTLNNYVEKERREENDKRKREGGEDRENMSEDKDNKNRDKKLRCVKRYRDELKEYMKSIFRNVIENIEEDELDVYMKGFDLRLVYNLIVNNNVSLLYELNKNKEHSENNDKKEEDDVNMNESNEIEMRKCLKCVIGGNFIGNPVLMTLLDILLILYSNKGTDSENEKRMMKFYNRVLLLTNKKEVKCRSCNGCYLNVFRFMNNDGLYTNSNDDNNMNMKLDGLKKYVLDIVGYYLSYSVDEDIESNKDKDKDYRELLKNQLKQLMEYLSLDVKDIVNNYDNNYYYNNNNKEDYDVYLSVKLMEEKYDVLLDEFNKMIRELNGSNAATSISSSNDKERNKKMNLLISIIVNYNEHFINNMDYESIGYVISCLRLFVRCNLDRCELMLCPVFVLYQLLLLVYKYIYKRFYLNQKNNNDNQDKHEKEMKVKRILFNDNLLEVCELVLNGEYYYMGENVEREMYLTVVRILYYLFNHYSQNNRDNNDEDQGNKRKREDNEKLKLNKYYQLLFNCYKCTNNMDDVLIKETMYRIIEMVGVRYKDRNDNNKNKNNNNNNWGMNDMGYYLRLKVRGYRLDRTEVVYKLHPELNCSSYGLSQMDCGYSYTECVDFNSNNNMDDSEDEYPDPFRVELNVTTNSSSRDSARDNRNDRVDNYNGNDNDNKKLRWDMYNKYMVFKKYEYNNFMESVDVENVLFNYNQCVFLNNNQDLVYRLSGLGVDDNDSRMKLLLYNYYIDDMEFVMRYLYKLVLVRYYRYVVSKKQVEVVGRDTNGNNNDEDKNKNNKINLSKKFGKMVVLVLYYLMKEKEWDKELVLRMVDMLLILVGDRSQYSESMVVDREDNGSKDNGTEDNNNGEDQGNKRKRDEERNKDNQNGDNSIKYILYYVKLNIETLDKQLVIKFILYLLNEFDENRDTSNTNTTSSNSRDSTRDNRNDRMKELLLKYNIGCINDKELNILYNWVNKMLLNDLVVGRYYNNDKFDKEIWKMVYLFKNGGDRLFGMNYLNSCFDGVKDRMYLKYFMENLL